MTTMLLILQATFLQTISKYRAALCTNKVKAVTLHVRFMARDHGIISIKYQKHFEISSYKVLGENPSEMFCGRKKKQKSFNNLNYSDV